MELDFGVRGTVRVSKQSKARMRSRSISKTGTRPPRHEIKKVICSLCNKEQGVQQNCSNCGACMRNTSVKNATSLMMLSQRVNTAVMDVAYAELVVWRTSFTAVSADGEVPAAGRVLRQGAPRQAHGGRLGDSHISSLNP